MLTNKNCTVKEWFLFQDLLKENSTLKTKKNASLLHYIHSNIGPIYKSD